MKLTKKATDTTGMWDDILLPMYIGKKITYKITFRPIIIQ